MSCVCTNIVVPDPPPVVDPPPVIVQPTPLPANQSLSNKIDKNPMTLDRLVRNWQYLWSRGLTAFMDLQETSGLELSAGNLRIATSYGLARSTAGLSVAMRPNRLGGITYDPTTNALLNNGLMLTGEGFGTDPATIPQAGDARYDNDTQRAILSVGPWDGSGNDTAVEMALGGVIDAQIETSDEVVNTTTETTLAEVTIKKNTLVAGKILHVRAFGTYATAGAVTLTMRLRAVLHDAMGSLALTTANTSSLDYGWSLEAMIACDSESSLRCSGTIQLRGATPVPFSVTAIPADTTADMDLTLSAQWSAAATTSKIICHQMIVELKN